MKLNHLGLGCAALFLGVLAGCDNNNDNNSSATLSAKRVLLISIDGFHQADLTSCLAASTCPTLAALAGSGVTYSAARTSTPSDSFPGLLAMVTGGTPKSTGVYYDDSYDRTLYAPGSNCVASTSNGPGIEAVFDESIEHDFTQLFSPIDPANLPMAKSAAGACTPVYPHNFIQVNTIFEVVKAAGGLTAWSDKHPAYDLVNGPSGTGVDDLYTPEINSPIANGGTVQGVDLAGSKSQCDGTTNSLALSKVTDYTTCIPSVKAYDDVKVQAVINEIDGKKSDGSAGTGVPVVFGMNFQEVSVGQKLPVGGYADATGTPSTQLGDVIAHTDASLGRMVAELKAKGLYDSTLIVISAKHGQSPIDKTTLAMEGGGHAPVQTVQDPSGSITTAGAVTDAPSSFTNPNSGAVYSTNGHLQTDDVGLIWLQDQSKIGAVASQLTTDATKIFADKLPAGTIFSGSNGIVSGAALVGIYGDSTSTTDAVAAARAPDIFIQPNAGVIYSGSSKKIAEHGGGTVDDTNVALIVSLSGLKASTVSSAVTTTQIAPTILKALGLDPTKLQAVQKEGTAALPNLF